MVKAMMNETWSIFENNDGSSITAFTFTFKSLTVHFFENGMSTLQFKNHVWNPTLQMHVIWKNYEYSSLPRVVLVIFQQWTSDFASTIVIISLLLHASGPPTCKAVPYS